MAGNIIKKDELDIKVLRAFAEITGLTQTFKKIGGVKIMYDKDKLREIDDRENKGVDDIISTEESENGVFELDERFANGYHVFIPYGISVNLLNAIETGIRTIGYQIDDKRKLISDIQKDEKNEVASEMVEWQNGIIEKYERDIKILRALSEVVSIV